MSPDSTEPGVPRLAVPAALARAGRQPVQTVNEGFVRFAELIPGGFGGMFQDGDKLVVWLKDASAQAAALNAILGQRKQGQAYRTLSAADIEFRTADYDWSELFDWYGRLTPVWDVDGVVATDMDEATNRLEVFVDNPVGTEAVRSEVRALGIPDKAVTVVVRGVARFAATLSSLERPALGGYKIKTTPSGKECTMGVTGRNGGQRLLLTNSHCTTTFMQPDPQDKVYQPINSSGGLIGPEHEDPLPFTNTWHSQCPPNDLCRFSDAVLFKFNTPADALPGMIERTTGIGSTTVNADTTRRWRIEDDDPSCAWVPEFICDYVGGTVLNLVGHISGWKQGTVTQSCQNELTQVPNTMLICQDWIGTTSTFGDSGAPVFEILWDDGGPHPSVALHGIVWGFFGSETVFSRIRYIQQELNTPFGIRVPPIIEGF